MKLVLISDTHMKEPKLPEGDILIHSGDMTHRGTLKEVIKHLDWLASQDFKNIILVPGNHDFLFEKEQGLARKLCEERGIDLLIDQELVIDGVKFYGSPQTPWFHNWAFNQLGHDIIPFWDIIPMDTDVLITHGPPQGILDELIYVDGTPKGIYVGCPHLLERVRIVKPDIHVFGHIHCGYGEKHVEGTSFYNASLCDEMYCATQAPHVVEYEKEKG